MGPGAIVVGVVAALGVWAAPARAAVHGRDGDLVVATVNGLELVSPATGAASPICTDVDLCGHPAQPSFSPNGRAIAFVDTATRRTVVIADDGSCLWCLVGARVKALTGSEPAFVAGGRAVTVARNGLWRASLTGGKARRLVKGVVTDAVWSSRGRVALVRGGWIWVGRPGHGKFHRLVRGRSPSFSPDGARLAFARGGYVWIVRDRGAERRRVRGDAPAWSPDGRQIAYIGPGGAVELIAVRGGRPHPVGAVHGSALAWQPLPDSVSRPCTPPRGSKVLASSREAVVYSRGKTSFGAPRVYGCLKALGRARLLSLSDPYYFHALVAVRLAGRFAAIESEASKGGAVDDALVYDLSTGRATQLAEAGDLYGAPATAIDSLALDSSGFAAWRQTAPIHFPNPISSVSCPSPSMCVAADGAGNILSSTNPTGGTGAWSVAPISPEFGPSIGDLSCPSSTLCLGLVGNYALVSSADPTGGPSAWSQAQIDPANFLDALTCPTASLCVATDVGNILTSTDPTGGAGAWAKTPIGRAASGYDISCPSVSLCVATLSEGSIDSSTDPTGGARAWKETTIDPGKNLGAVSCPSVSLCVVAGQDGILTSTNPTGGAGAWKKTAIDLQAISCPSVSLCVAGDQKGNVLTSTDPTGGASAWKKTTIDPGSSLQAISCPSVSLCVMAGDQNGNVLTSTDPTGGAKAWTSAAIDMPPCAIAPSQCVSDELYVRDDQGTRAIDSARLGSGNLISNVILHGDSLSLSWTKDGAPQQLELR